VPADPTTIHGARVDKGSVFGMGCGAAQCVGMPTALPL
jgi:hypothetical protein